MQNPPKQSIKILCKTQGVCEQCHRRVPAYTFLRKGRVRLRKFCPEHGELESGHVWDDPEVYQALAKTDTLDAPAGQVAFVISYKCNLNCPVCYARANERDVGEMNLSDLEKVSSYDTFFFTGGEPTVSPKLPRFMKELRRRGKKIVIFTNGIKMADFDYARQLKKAGLRNIILQFDSFRDSESLYIRGDRLLKTKIKTLKNMRRLRIPVYLQATILKDRNFGEIPKIFKFAFRQPMVKSIGLNHLWKLGRYNGKDFLPTSAILKRTNEILGISNRDWTESTRLLIGIDKLLSLFRKQKRVFCKCNLKCLVLREKNEIIPLTKVFNTRKLNRQIQHAYENKSRLGVWALVLNFLFCEVLVNFFRNPNFRIFVRQLVRNRRYLRRREYLLSNPFYFVVINVFPTTRNMDFNFVNQCNFNAASPGNFDFNPACIHRINLLRPDRKIEFNAE